MGSSKAAYFVVDSIGRIERSNCSDADYTGRDAVATAKRLGLSSMADALSAAQAGETLEIKLTTPNGIVWNTQLVPLASEGRVVILASEAGCPAGEKHYVAVVQRPEGWQPHSEFDEPPPGCPIIESLDGRVDREWLRHYNAASMDAGGSSWAVFRRLSDE
jgi:hypothetical protein